jgi:hypothetical protein
LGAPDELRRLVALLVCRRDALVGSVELRNQLIGERVMPLERPLEPAPLSLSDAAKNAWRGLEANDASMPHASCSERFAAEEISLHR